MDARPTDVKPKSDSDRAALDAADARYELSDLIGEIERRFRVWTDVRGQAIEHVVPIAIAGGALLLVAGGGIAIAAIRARERRRPAAKLERLRDAIARMTKRPERVAVKPTVLQSVASKALSAAVSALVVQGIRVAVKALEDSPRRERVLVETHERPPTVH